MRKVISNYDILVSIIVLSVANGVTKERIREHLIADPERLLVLTDNLKKLLKRITFQKPYHNFFEKKKIQVIRKVSGFIIELLVEIFGENINPEYYKIIS